MAPTAHMRRRPILRSTQGNRFSVIIGRLSRGCARVDLGVFGCLSAIAAVCQDLAVGASCDELAAALVTASGQAGRSFGTINLAPEACSAARFGENLSRKLAAANLVKVVYECINGGVLQCHFHI